MGCQIAVFGGYGEDSTGVGIGGEPSRKGIEAIQGERFAGARVQWALADRSPRLFVFLAEPTRSSLDVNGSHEQNGSWSNPRRFVVHRGND